MADKSSIHNSEWMCRPSVAASQLRDTVFSCRDECIYKFGVKGKTRSSSNREDDAKCEQRIARRRQCDRLLSNLWRLAQRCLQLACKNWWQPTVSATWIALQASACSKTAPDQQQASSYLPALKPTANGQWGQENRVQKRTSAVRISACSTF